MTKSTRSSFSASSTTNRRVNNNSNKFPFKQKGVSTDSKEQEVNEKGPCDGKKCKKLLQMPVPPSCECMCPGPANRTCSPEKVFNDNLCECLCREINFDCPGNSNFNFDMCNCVCQLKKSDCGPQKTLDPDQCICVIDQPQSSTPKPAQSHHTCSLQCRGTNQYLDHRACKCCCRRYLIKQATDNFNYRRGQQTTSTTGVGGLPLTR